MSVERLSMDNALPHVFPGGQVMKKTVNDIPEAVIYSVHEFPATRKQIKLLKSVADDSFMQFIRHSDWGKYPEFPGFIAQELTALSCRNVLPHVDPWVGEALNGEEIGLSPAGRRAAFWLIDIDVERKFNEPVVLQCGTKMVILKKGSVVCFDDRVLHGVYSLNKWWGLAFQLRPEIASDRNQPHVVESKP